MSPIIKADRYLFTYNHNESVNKNFDNWRILNHEERSDWGEQLLTWQEGKTIFESQYSVKVTTQNG
tara:strand:- start:676 stop:873 length:198 start_codon:yes stop_codon:yes gene_type:complete